jgi:hypothetical protein
MRIAQKGGHKKSHLAKSSNRSSPRHKVAQWSQVGWLAGCSLSLQPLESLRLRFTAMKKKKDEKSFGLVA